MELPLGINLVNIVIYIVLFTVLYLALAKFLFPALDNAMKKRQEVIDKSLEDAKKAEDALLQVDVKIKQTEVEAKELVNSAHKVGKDEASQIIEEAKLEAQSIVDRAKQKADQYMLDAQNQIDKIVEARVREVLKNSWTDKSVNNDEIAKAIAKLKQVNN
ncbi:MAG TPA: ATP synthase F0 subunit B [Candidatus Dojkabacteria bacterium]|nr:ATP synthase F0 subunit B [Candidatus Dojkabacteria bacterium]